MVTELNILVIEDHDLLREVTVDALCHNGYKAESIDCAESLDDEMAGKAFDIYIIDLNLPGEDGLSLVQRIRDSQPLAGIVILTARMRMSDKLLGYNSGADIYLTKPIDQSELIAVVDALGQRIVKTKRAMLPKSDLILELNLNTRILNGLVGKELLSNSEVTMLVALGKASSNRLETWQLIELIGENVETYPKSSLEVRITRLRYKIMNLGADKSCLLSLRDFGYYLTIQIRIN
jgi:DNA-binding response OmpR family regulator